MFDVIGKINIWGDSVLKGVIFDEIRNKYTTLEDDSASLVSKDLGLEIKNNARFGLTAPKAEKLLLSALEKGVDCQTAIIELGGNDSDFNWVNVAENPDMEHQPNTTLEAFKSSITNMVEALRKHNIVPVLVNLPPIDAEKYFTWITRSGLDKDKILKWLGDVQRIYRYHECYSLAVTKLARTLNCHFIDIRSAFLLEVNYTRYLCIDGIHPNSEGHKLMNKVFNDYYENYIKTGSLRDLELTR